MNRKFSISNWQLAIGVFLTFLLATQHITAATTELSSPDEIPPLRPPKPELIPGFWEQNGLMVVVLVVTALLLLAVLWKALRQKQSPPPPSPAETARTALTALNAHPVDLKLHDEVSAILRTYFVATLKLPVQALTNRELCSAIDPAGPEAAEKARSLLLALDQHRFDPDLNQPVANTLEAALHVVELTEAHLRPPEEPVQSAPRSNS